MGNVDRRTALKGIGASSLAWSPAAHLWAAPSTTTPLLRFGLIADVQYVDAAARGSRHYRESLPKLEAAVEQFNKTENLAFIAHLGDSIDREFESIPKVTALFETLEAPFHQVLGNHDFEVAEERVKDVPSALGLASPHYTFTGGGLRFIVLDGNADSIYAGEDPEASRGRLEELKKSGAPQAQRWNGGLGPHQIAWLEDQLDAAEEAGEEVILFCHFPIYPQDPHNLWDCEEVIRLLGEHEAKVRAWFNGHNHRGNYGRIGDVHCVTLQGLVETPDTNAFCTAAIYPDRIELDGFDREGDRVLRLESGA